MRWWHYHFLHMLLHECFFVVTSCCFSSGQNDSSLCGLPMSSLPPKQGHGKLFGFGRYLMSYECLCCD
ncbi:hypothetical protein LINPERHAP1_LOCUS31335 [Linum perenne]